MWQKVRLLTGDGMSKRLLEGKSPDDEEDYQDDAECKVRTRRLMEMVRRIVTMTISHWLTYQYMIYIMTLMKGKIGDQPERVESQPLQLSPGLALAWAAGAVVHLQWDYLEDLHRHHQPSAHDLNYWDLLCLASRPCNTPGGDDHQVNRHIHWDEVWADFRPGHYFIFFQTLVPTKF